MKGKTIQILEGNIGEYFPELGTDKDFLNSILKVLNIKESVEIGLGNIQISVYKKTPLKERKKATKWKKIFEIPMSNKVLISRIYKELQLNKK